MFPSTEVVLNIDIFFGAFLPRSAGVPGGPIVSRVTIEVELVGSNLTGNSYKLTGRKRESVSWPNSMQTDEQK